MAKRKGPLRVKKKRAPGGEKAMSTRAVKGRATPERMAQAGGDAYVGADGIQRLVPPLDSLKARGAITPDQFDAGERYANDCEMAGTLKSSVSNMERGGSGYGSKAPGFMATDAAMAASDRVNEANKAVGGGLIDVVRAVVLAMAGEKVKEIGRKMFGRKNAGEAGAALVEILKVGLNQLAAHYAGTEVDEHGRPMERRSRIRGVRDEKPTVREDMWRKDGTG